jgi:hypothetical protein
VRALSFRSIALTLVGLLAAIQLVPVRRDNPPPAAGPLTAPAPVVTILRRACIDCHSNETTWPWYSYVAPVSWLVAHDVHEGREYLNFSEWAGYTPSVRLKKLALLSGVVQNGEMPPWFYTPLHPAALLSSDDVSELAAWADNSAGDEPGTAFTDPGIAAR